MIPIEGPGIALSAPHQVIAVDPAPLEKSTSVDATGGAIFESLLRNVVGDANDSIHKAEAVGKDFAAGTRDDIHGTMLALSKADIELRLVGNIRNKVVDAFYELWRMQI